MCCMSNVLVYVCMWFVLRTCCITYLLYVVCTYECVCSVLWDMYIHIYVFHYVTCMPTCIICVCVVC